jgi:hypothetical protein
MNRERRPAVEKPRSRGFGSLLIERGLRQELGADVNLDFKPTVFAFRCSSTSILRPGN